MRFSARARRLVRRGMMVEDKSRQYAFFRGKQGSQVHDRGPLGLHPESPDRNGVFKVAPDSHDAFPPITQLKIGLDISPNIDPETGTLNSPIIAVRPFRR